MYPILFEFSFFGHWLIIPAWGTAFGFSLLIGTLIALRLAEQDGFAKSKTLNIYLVGIIVAIIGARLLSVATNFEAYADNFPYSIIDFKNVSGMVAYGGYLGGMHGVIIAMAFTYKGQFLKFSDNIAPLMALGLGFTRIGCLLAGCDFGKPTNLPIGISFPARSYAYMQQIHDGLISNGATESLPVIPTQIIESSLGFILFFVLLWFHKTHRKKSGETLGSFFILYGVSRFLLEFLRGDGGRGIYFYLSTSQWIAILTISIGIFLLTRPLTKKNQLISKIT